MQSASEGSVVELAVERNHSAFSALYDYYVKRVYRHVFYRVLDQSDAEDITQDVFIKAWKAISRYKKTGAPFIAWLIVIANNLIVDHFKGRKKEVPLDSVQVISDSVDDDPEAVFDTKLKRRHIRDTILKLKGDRQKVIMMRFIDGLSYGEIAQALGKSEGAIRVVQYRALNDLRRMLRRSGE